VPPRRTAPQRPLRLGEAKTLRGPAGHGAAAAGGPAAPGVVIIPPPTQPGHKPARTHDYPESTTTRPIAAREPSPRPPAVGRPSMPSLAIGAEPTVLVVGDGSAELESALAARGICCETTEADVAESAVAAVVPDVVLVTSGAGDDLVGRLRASVRDRVLPIAVLTSENDLTTRLEAFREGAAAVFFDRDGPDALAEQIEGLIRELVRRGGHTVGKVGETSLDELVSTLKDELRSELLPKEDRDAAGPVRLVLGGGKPLATALHEFVSNVKRYVLSATQEPGVDELPAAPAEPASANAPARETDDIAGMRIVVADDDVARADVVAQALRARGALVLVSDLAPAGARIERLRRLDPEVVVLGDVHVPGPGLELLKRMRDDCRLRWASLLVVRWREVWPSEATAPKVESLLGTLAGLDDAEHSVVQRAAAGLSFELRLETIGPTRLLRALSRSPEPVRCHTENPRLQVEFEAFGGRVFGASARGAAGTRELRDLAAISAFSVLRSGRVSVEKCVPAPDAEPLGSVDEVLAKMEGERVPVEPSLFPEALGNILPSMPPSPALPRLDASPEPRAHDEAPAEIATPVAASPGILEPRSRPVFVAIGVALVAASLLAGAIGLITLRRHPAPSAAPAASAASAAAPSATVAEAAPSSPSELERARGGDEAALKELEAILPERRSAEQAFALTEGRARLEAAKSREFAEGLVQHPERLREKKTRRLVLRAARDPVSGPETLRALARIADPTAPDLIYQAWVGTQGHTPVTELAQSLLFSNDVRKRASPALAAALDLRSAESCDAMQSAVERATEQGDRRAFVLLARLTRQTGCGPKKTEDCYPCLRGGDSLKKAIDAARMRPAPSF
jgi:DNA-binding response OmpR family regulator